MSTKVGRLIVTCPGGEQTRRVDFSADGIRRSLDASRLRSGIDFFDLVLVHDPDEHEDDARRHAVPALLAMRSAGEIGAVGVGMNDPAMLTRFVTEFPVDAVLVAGRYTLLDQSASGTGP